MTMSTPTEPASNGNLIHGVSGAADNEPIAAVLERHYSPAEIAERLGLSEQTVIRMFQDEPGVLKIGNGFGKKRNYVTLRIPESVLRRVIEVRSR